jgi:Dyp-type peroxidase family
MDRRGNILGDPPRATWNPVGWQGPRPDALFLLADADPDAVEADLEAAEGWLNGTGVRILVVERGLQQTRNFRANTPEGVEHFGYVDGRSQPLFLTEDIVLEDKTLWDPVFKPSQFIVADPNGRSSLSAGSYFVFRKLEQNVRGFNAAEDALGKSIFGNGATQDQLDRAGAMVVGRFEDGTPLVLSANGLAAPVTNDFTYAVDPDGAKCPFHAHIRKVNPRGDIERITGTADTAPGRVRIMARRGITYGELRPHNADGSEFDDAGHEPEKDVGLLFMAYMASIEDQFEFTQQSWADNPGFVANINPAKPHPETGIDPIIGQSATAADRDHTYLDGWTAGAQPKTLNFAQFVTMQGGEYFFAPSLQFLRSVGL